MPRSEVSGDRLDLDARRRFRGVETFRAQASFGKETLRDAYTADLERREPLGLESAADDELGRSAADVDDEPRLERSRQLVRDAQVDQPSFLVHADHAEWQAER